MLIGKLSLLGDIGATNARFALLRPDGGMTPPTSCSIADFPSLSAAAESYLAEAQAAGGSAGRTC